METHAPLDEVAQIHLYGHPPVQRAWLPPLVWSLLSLAALFVFELTAQPALSAVILCSKAGWEDLLTGLWLRRVDPNAGRGAACFWFSLLIGVAKIFAAAVALSIAMIIATVVWMNMGHPAGAAVEKQKPSSAIVALWRLVAIAEAPLILLGLAGCVVARWHNVKVWVSPMLHRARRAKQWPPGQPSAADSKNMGDRALVAAIALGVTAIILVAMTLILEMQLPVAPVIILALVVFVAIVWLSRGVTATAISECWPESAPREPAVGTSRGETESSPDSYCPTPIQSALPASSQCRRTTGSKVFSRRAFYLGSQILSYGVFIAVFGRWVGWWKLPALVTATAFPLVVILSLIQWFTKGPSRRSGSLGGRNGKME